MKNISPGKALLPTLVMIYLGKEAGLYIFLEQFKKAIEVIEQK